MTSCLFCVLPNFFCQRSYVFKNVAPLLIRRATLLRVPRTLIVSVDPEKAINSFQGFCLQNFIPACVREKQSFDGMSLGQRLPGRNPACFVYVSSEVSVPSQHPDLAVPLRASGQRWRPFLRRRRHAAR